MVATKVYGAMAGAGPHGSAAAPNRSGLGRKHIIEACEASLKRLRMDYIDLYQIHRWDFGTPIEETLDALDALVRAGKVRYLGASSMAASQFAKARFIAQENGWHRLVSMQNHYNLVYREEEREMIPLCIDQGVGLIPWTPLARGFLSRSRERASADTTVRARDNKFARSVEYQQCDFDVLDAVSKVATERSVTNSQVALAWVLQAPGVDAPIIGSTKLGHLDEAIAALGLKLTGEEVAALESPIAPINPGTRTAQAFPHEQIAERAHFARGRCEGARGGLLLQPSGRQRSFSCRRYRRPDDRDILEKSGAPLPLTH